MKSQPKKQKKTRNIESRIDAKFENIFAELGLIGRLLVEQNDKYDAFLNRYPDLFDRYERLKKASMM